ncbi:hypothetical protein [Ferruginibacter sp.]
MLIFRFKNRVEDVINVVAFCKQYQGSLQMDTSNIVLFGHSMAGWVCLKAIQQMPSIADTLGKYFVLNGSLKDRFEPVIQRDEHFNLEKNIDALKRQPHHAFSNKRVSLINMVLAFLNRKAV